MSNRSSLLLHIGDVSYCDDEPLPNAPVMDAFLERMEDFISRVPYMTSPGNHERQFNFSSYINRFPMPAAESGAASPFWYSFNYGLVHVATVSTEPEHPIGPGSEQHAWLLA